MIWVNFFDPKISHRCAQDILEVKKVLAPLKNPSKLLIMCFACIKKSPSKLSESAVKSAKPDRGCITDCLNSCAIVVCLLIPENKCYKLEFASIYLE